MTTSTTTNPGEARLYDVLLQHHVDDDVLPTQETLDEVESALAGVWEFQVEPVFQAVLKVVQAGKANTITVEDIGRLVIAADHIADRAREIVATAAKINVAAREAYDLALGYEGECVLFNENGVITDRKRFECVLRGEVR